MRSNRFRVLVEQVIHALDGELHDTDYQYGSTSLRAMIAKISRSECKDYLDERLTAQAKTIEKQKQVIAALHEKLDEQIQVHHLEWPARSQDAWDADMSPDAHKSRFTD